LSEYPIEGLMTTAMESIKNMVDVNTIVGDAVQAPDGTVIIPISRVAFGFAAGGGEYGKVTDGNEKNTYEASDNDKLPFAGGSGAGVSINPVAFMVVGQGQIKLLPTGINSSLEKIMSLVPEIIDKIENTVKKKVKIKKDMPKQEEDEDTKKVLIKHRKD
jgi:sporulation protein YtfJ